MTDEQHDAHDDAPTEPAGSYMAALGVRITFDGRTGTALAPVRPETFAPGTTRMRTGYLAALVDVIAGHSPNSAIGPTVDLRVQVLSLPPTSGVVRLESVPLKVGSRLKVIETTLHAGDDPVPFARSTSTFMDVGLEGGMKSGDGWDPEPIAEGSLDAFLGATVRDESSLQLESAPRLVNAASGTILGAAQVLLAELAAEHLLGGGRWVAGDFDFRFLDRLRIGPLVATATGLASADGQHRVAVMLSDGGNGRIVGHVVATMVPVEG